MKKKHKKIQKVDNLIIFPGMIENLLADGLAYAEEHNYVKAALCFDEAKKYVELDEMILSVYVLTLLETRRQQEAKEICENLLEENSPIFEQIVELYLTILLDLKEYKEVESLLENLVSDNRFSDDRKKNFKQLKELNSRLSSEQKDSTNMDDETIIDHVDKEKFQMDVFTKLTLMEQEQLLHDSFYKNISDVVQEIIEIVESNKVSLPVQTLALILLGGSGVTASVTVEKFGFKEKVNPMALPSPNAVERIDLVNQHVQEILEKDPSKLELTTGLVHRHAYALFPFDWTEFCDVKVAEAYVHFVNTLFGEENLKSDKLYDLIKLLEDSAQVVDND
ncbi:hypothetical protein [Psychrobacillus vulpis]|uniref:Tetratricopeptide repeat protein n=1 Tax=Psychrobacillus vulpis TaxID=2325572 RepID=A0A544TR20_9BACI|nr:hypothetical protein [Psychrobacillus vulpis]TQR19888.1 hypothetical protein FG384_10635 [Psychrobacillus vulpis]